jgi:hypothetical protein
MGCIVDAIEIVLLALLGNYTDYVNGEVCSGIENCLLGIRYQP